jgi:cell division protein FtsW (lipid II flippase)
MQTPGAFRYLLAAGLAALIGLQALLIMGGVVRLIPLTGLTLPFVSYGGSSLVTNFCIIGLLLRLSAPATRP